MTPQEALNELLARVGARNGGAVLVSAEELHQWPVAAVAAMKSQKLLTRARPAKSVVCPGCERACVMPVQTLTQASGTAASFVVCDKRDDINRVGLSADLTTQWRCDAEAVCAFIAKALNVRRSEQEPADKSLKIIGMARGEKRSQMIALQVNGSLPLVVGDSAVPLAELVTFDHGKYAVDAATIRQLVDSASTADPRYTPSNARREARKLDTQAIYEEWRKAYRALKKKRPDMSDIWCARQIAKTEISRGKSHDTIRRHMKN
jgi:hypothetical protein